MYSHTHTHVRIIAFAHINQKICKAKKRKRHTPMMRGNSEVTSTILIAFLISSPTARTAA